MKKLLLIMLVLLIAGLAFGDVVIGNGTSTDYYPMSTLYNYYRSAALYTAADISANDGPITNLQWYCGTANTTTSIPVKIYMKYTAAAALTGDTWVNLVAGTTQVFNATITANATGWFNFDITDFAYDGDLGNLMVLVESGSAAYVSPYVMWQYTTTGVSGSYKFASNRADGSAPTSLTAGSARPNIKLVGINAAVYPEPTNHVLDFTTGTLTTTSIQLNWTGAVGAQLPAGYLIQAKTAAGTFANVADGTPVANDALWTDGNFAINVAHAVGANTYTLTGLSPNTAYEIKIWPYTNSGANINFKTDAPIPTVNASTLDPTQPLPYTQNFNSGTSLTTIGWTGDMYISSTHGNAGSNGLYRNLYSFVPTTNVVSCPIGPMVANAELDFDYRIVDYSGYPATGTALSATDKIEVQISTNGGTSFTTIYTINSANHVTSNAFASKVVELDAYSTGNIYVKFLSTWGAGDYYVDIDNVQVRETPAAPIFSLTPTSWDFLAVDVTVPANKVFTITNTGGGTLGLTSVGITTGTPYYTISTPPATMSLGAGLSTTFTVTFDPEAAIAYEGVITIVHSLGSTTVDLDGTGLVRPAGSTVGNPYPVTLPLVGFTGDTSLYGDDYESGWVTPSNSYIGGDDMVLQFTLAVPSTVSGTLAATDGGTWVGMILVNTTPDPTTPAPVLGSGTSSGSTATMAGVNLAAGTYYLIISTWPTPQSFAFTLDLNAVVLTAPGPATPTAPVNNAVGVSLLPTFTWTAPTTGSAPTGYRVFCDTNTAPNTLIGTVTGLNYTAINSLVYNTLYYWKVVAYNSVGDAIGNTVWSFTTQVDPTNPPTAPILLSPDGTALMPVEGFNFTWAVNGTGGNPSGYKLYVSREGGAGFFDAAFSYDLEATVTSYDPTEAGVDPMTYTYSTHYWWTVRADDAEGPYQAPIEFVIEDDPTEAVPYQQDFESASTLASINWSGNMLVGAPHGVNASKGAYFNLYDSEGWWTCSAITPPVGPMPANPTPSQLKFDYRIVNWSGYPATATALGTLDNVQIQVSTDGGANYTTIHTINQANHVTSNLFAPVTLDLSAYASQIIMIQFLGTWGAGDYYLDIDNVFVRESPTLPIFSVTPTVGIYGEVELNVASPVTFVVSNLGVGSLDINSIGIAGPDQASFVLLNPPTYPVHITDTPVSFVVQFTPTTLGEKTATLTFTDALTRTTHEIPLSGTGINEAMITGLNLSGSVINNCNVQLNWVPVTTDGFGTWVHYDDGANSSGVGYNAPATFAVAIKYSTATLTPYIGQNLTSVKFFPYVADALYTVKVWKGTDDAMAPSTLLYSSPVPYFTGNAWNEHPINPILINGTDAIYIGYEVTTTWGYPAGADAGPALVGYGDLLYTTTGEWVSMMTAYSIDRNWNLQGYVTPGPTAISGNLLNIPVVSNTTKSSSMRNAQIPSVDPRLSSTSSDRFITGYKVYRNTVLITPTPVQGLAYLDSDLTDGNYEYYVVAQYANGTVTSNTYSTPITGLPPIDLPFLEDWSSSSLDTNNWIAGSTNWLIETSQGNATPSVKFSWTPQVLDYDITLTSFRFDGTDLANIKLKFDIALDNYSTNAENLMSWDVFDGTTWHTMGTISSLVDDFGWTTYASDITAFAAGHDFKVRFRAHGEDSYEINYWYIDNIRLELMPTTLTVPANVEISVSGTDLTLAWDAVAGADWYAIYVSQDPYADPYVYAGWLNANGITLPAATFGNPGFLKITAGAGAEPGRGIRLDTPEPPNFPPTKK